MRAKKTPPKTAEQMSDMHQAGCLPDWTPVLGLEQDVSTFNSLPPSLFMTLGSLRGSRGKGGESVGGFAQICFNPLLRIPRHQLCRRRCS